MNRREFGRNVIGASLVPLYAGSESTARGSTGLTQGTEPTPRGVEITPPHGEAPGVPFKLSVMLWTVYRNLPFEERIEKMAEAGFHAVELVGEYKDWSEEDFRRANAKRRELGLTFDTTAGLPHGVGDPSEREAFLADLRHELPIMEKIECPACIVMSGNRVPGMSRDAQHDSCIEGLKRAAEIVEGKNVRLLLENIDPEENPKYFLTSVAEGFEIMRAVNHPQVRFCYDFFHEQIAEGNLIEKLEKNIDFVGLVHIADVPGRHEPGTGEIDYQNIFKKLGQLNYNWYAAMEYLPLGDPVESLRSMREMALRAGRV